MKHLILFLTLIVFLAGSDFQKQADQQFKTAIVLTDLHQGRVEEYPSTLFVLKFIGEL
jgi:hypothetical protein